MIHLIERLVCYVVGKIVRVVGLGDVGLGGILGLWLDFAETVLIGILLFLLFLLL
jgi:hypothetical protein